MEPPIVPVDDEGAPTDPEVLHEYISTLAANDTHAPIAYELEALEAIYPDSIRLRSAGPSRVASPSEPSTTSFPNLSTPSASAERIRYEVSIPAWDAADPSDPSVPRVRVLVSLPAAYPSNSAPLLQLLGRYVGAYPIDAGLFGDITRTYISSAGVPFVAGDVCVFDGLVHVQSRVGAWHAERVADAGEREAVRDATHTPTTPSTPPPPPQQQPPGQRAPAQHAAPSHPAPPIVSSEPITDRKSVFIGHCVRITDADADVPAVMAALLADRRIARAAHPTIWAYRAVRVGVAGPVVESDYDDDGETQAGSRLKHLLEILEVENVLVVVTRWFGGVHLGPDRFKHINQAARDALELAGVLDDHHGGGGGKKKGRK